ncbi:MAG: NAD(P)H-dependent oxidoreductase [Lachnospiraceae bacterium]|nr:NAD(P)H-dependent oxidoreductase [Lachnospiraceae bacterium]
MAVSFTACGGNTGQENNNDIADTLNPLPESGADSESESASGSVRDGGTEGSEQAPDSTESVDADTPAGSNILVAYFSLADEQYEVGVVEKGNTQIVAKIIADQTGADTFSIESTVAYPTTYDGLLEISREEENNPPEIAGTVENMDDYNIIFIGYPIWWGDLPAIVKVFLESYDLSGKTVIPFCTHAGSGLSGTQGTVETLCDGATIEDGLAVRGKTAQEDMDSAESSVTEWLRGLGFVE